MIALRYAQRRDCGFAAALAGAAQQVHGHAKPTQITPPNHARTDHLRLMAATTDLLTLLLAISRTTPPVLCNRPLAQTGMRYLLP